MMDFPEITDSTFNTFTFVSPMGGGKSTTVRSLIYYTTKFDPEIFTVIIDPMKMEFEKLGIINNDPNKKEGLLHGRAYDEELGKTINFQIEPDTLPVFHVIPRWALKKDDWDQESGGYNRTYDKTSMDIIQRQGGFIFAEDLSRMGEEQLFHALNYRDTRDNQAIHYYLRAAKRICDMKYGRRRWFIKQFIKILRDGVKNYSIDEETQYYEYNPQEKPRSTHEMALIEQLERYNDVGFFVNNAEERDRYYVDFRKFVRLGKVINISYLGFKRGERLGEDLALGQTDLILQRLMEISNEYMEAVRKHSSRLNLNDWEEYLIKHWRLNMWFEESEVFVPRDCNQEHIKKWPCIKRINEIVSTGRKYGFKNLGFVTQRMEKLNKMIYEVSSHIFLGPLVGEGRDQILSDFGVNKMRVNMGGKEVAIRDVVSTLNKDRHEWVFISKNEKKVAAISTYDSPCG